MKQQNEINETKAEIEPEKLLQAPCKPMEWNQDQERSKDDELLGSKEIIMIIFIGAANFDAILE